MENFFRVFPELRSYSEADYRELAIEKPVLMLAMTARTGSTNFCDALGRVLRAGEPVEIFNPRGVAQWQKSKRGVSDFRAYLASLEVDAHGYFIFKTSWQDFSPWVPFYRIVFPSLRIAYLDRIDIEAQAVSLFKAIVSNHWHKLHGQGAPDDHIDMRFDLKRICKMIRVLEEEKRNWELFFFKEGHYPARIHYENFASDVNVAIKYLVEFLGLTYDSGMCVVSKYEKLADDLSRTWISEVKTYRDGNYYIEHDHTSSG
jgi:LPS sulfotransferase NodH